MVLSSVDRMRPSRRQAVKVAVETFQAQVPPEAGGPDSVVLVVDGNAHTVADTDRARSRGEALRFRCGTWCSEAGSAKSVSKSANTAPGTRVAAYVVQGDAVVVIKRDSLQGNGFSRRLMRSGRGPCAFRRCRPELRRGDSRCDLRPLARHPGLARLFARRRCSPGSGRAGPSQQARGHTFRTGQAELPGTRAAIPPTDRAAPAGGLVGQRIKIFCRWISRGRLFPARP